MHVGNKKRIIRDVIGNRGWQWQRSLSGPEAGALLVKVALDHCGRVWLMLADLLRGQPGPAREVPSVNGFAPGGDAWGEHGCMVKRDAIGNGVGGND
jgi:hypothetical protein